MIIYKSKFCRNIPSLRFCLRPRYDGTLWYCEPHEETIDFEVRTLSYFVVYSSSRSAVASNTIYDQHCQQDCKRTLSGLIMSRYSIYLLIHAHSLLHRELKVNVMTLICLTTYMRHHLLISLLCCGELGCINMVLEYSHLCQI